MAADADTSVEPGGLVEVAELIPVQWHVVRAMRRDALSDAPGAFVNTWAAERGLSATQWQDRFTDATWVAARSDATFVGIARLAPPDGHPPRAPYVESVWVQEQYRRRGVLRQMMKRLEKHALAINATELRLWVLDTNGSAGLAYQRLGFEPMDVAQPTTKSRDDGTPVMERLMSKPLRES